MVDTQDLKSCGLWLCGFKSRSGYRKRVRVRASARAIANTLISFSSHSHSHSHFCFPQQSRTLSSLFPHTRTHTHTHTFVSSSRASTLVSFSSHPPSPLTQLHCSWSMSRWPDHSPPELIDHVMLVVNNCYYVDYIYGLKAGLKWSRLPVYTLKTHSHTSSLFPQAAYRNYQHTIRPLVCNLATC